MQPAAIKTEISFDDLTKIDIRVGTIIEVLGVAKSDKLIVDFGDHSRSILAGIKQERTKPKEINDKQALLIVNYLSAG
jgi:tRNA-binding protein